MPATPTTETPDHTLVQRALAGDDRAFHDLVRRYQGPVFACTRAITGNTADAADAAQEAFIRLHRHLAQVDPNRPLKPYLLRIAANCARTLYRNRHPLTEPLATDETLGAIPDPRGTPQSGLLRTERHTAVRAFVEALPRTLREVCSLFYLADCACHDIAETLQMSETAVKVALHRARQKLRQSELAEWRTP